MTEVKTFDSDGNSFCLPLEDSQEGIDVYERNDGVSFFKDKKQVASDVAVFEYGVQALIHKSEHGNCDSDSDGGIWKGVFHSLRLCMYDVFYGVFRNVHGIVYGCSACGKRLDMMYFFAGVDA